MQCGMSDVVAVVWAMAILLSVEGTAVCLFRALLLRCYTEGEGHLGEEGEGLKVRECRAPSFALHLFLVPPTASSSSLHCFVCYPVTLLAPQGSSSPLYPLLPSLHPPHRRLFSFPPNFGEFVAVLFSVSPRNKKWPAGT